MLQGMCFTVPPGARFLAGAKKVKIEQHSIEEVCPVRAVADVDVKSA